MTDKLDELFNQLSNQKNKEEIIFEFLKINERDPGTADLFFQKYGGAIYLSEPQDLPYSKRNHTGRIAAYLDLLSLIQESDPVKFQKIHKGTPYCILGWLFLDIGSYEQALFYIDNAISEDVRSDPAGWVNRPAPRFLFLEKREIDNVVSKRIIEKTRNSIEEKLKNFNQFSNNSGFTIGSFTENFVYPKVKEVSHRTLICSLYTFILEGQDRIKMLKYRSIERGSIEPFLIHLHKGSLVLESLLKEIYTSFSSSTLAKILNDPFIRNDLEISLYEIGAIGKTLEDIIIHLMPKLKHENIKIHNKWLTISYCLRNVTSHSLLWPDLFNENIYEELYNQILFSIFYIIKKKYGQI